MGLLKGILDFLASPVTAWVEGKQARDYMKTEGNLAIKKAEVALKVSKFEAEAERLRSRDTADVDYDLRAQQERRFTIADEVLMFCTVVLVSCHFVIPDKMQAGWEAMGYMSPPWWLEFIIVGMFVSVFGLMRLFRAFNPFNKEKSNGK